MTLRATLLLLLTLALSGCTLLSEHVNAKWPPATVRDAQRQGLDTNAKTFSVLGRSTLAFHVAANDVLTRGKEHLEAALAGITLEGAKDVQLRNVRLALIKQGIQVHADFSLNVKQVPDLNITGNLVGVAAVGVQDKTVIIRPAFQSVRIQNAHRGSSNDMRALAVIVNALLSKYLDNLNGVLAKKPLQIALNLHFAETTTLRALLGGVEGGTVTGGDEALTITASLEKLALLINEAGISGLAGLDVQVEKSVEAAEPPSAAEDTFDVDFAAYQAEYHAELRRSFGSEPQTQTEVLIARRSLAGFVNRVLERVDVCVDIAEMKHEEKFSEKLSAHNISSIDCGGLRKDCDQVGPSCNQDCGERYGEHNCRSCRGIHRPDRRIRCVGEREACKAEQAIHRGSCEFREQSCRTEQQLERTRCRLANEGRVAECKVARQVREGLGNLLDLGEMAGNVEIVGGGRVCITAPVMSEDLTSLAVGAAVKASARIFVHLDYNPEGLGHVACVLNFRKDFRFNGAVDQVVKINAEQSLKPQPDGSLRMESQLSFDPVNVSFSPTPWQQMVSDPTFVANCTFLTIALPSVAIASAIRGGEPPKGVDELVYGRTEIDVPSRTFGFTVKPVSMEVGPQTLLLYPAATPLAIGFRMAAAR